MSGGRASPSAAGQQAALGMGDSLKSNVYVSGVSMCSISYKIILRELVNSLYILKFPKQILMLENAFLMHLQVAQSYLVIIFVFFFSSSYVF